MTPQDQLPLSQCWDWNNCRELSSVISCQLRMVVQSSSEQAGCSFGQACRVAWVPLSDGAPKDRGSGPQLHSRGFLPLHHLQGRQCPLARGVSTPSGLLGPAGVRHPCDWELFLWGHLLVQPMLRQKSLASPLRMWGAVWLEGAKAGLSPHKGHNLPGPRDRV